MTYLLLIAPALWLLMFFAAPTRSGNQASHTAIGWRALSFY
jgi:hypothetical protein